MSVLGKNIPHDSSLTHVTGQSAFIDDLPPQRGELFLEIFGSPVAHGRVKSLDLAAARDVTGVELLLTGADVPGHNTFGPIVADDHLFAVDVVQCAGDPLVLIAATSRAAALQAKRLIRVEIEPLEPILDLPTAITRQSFLGPQRLVETGDVVAAMSAADRTLSGELIIGGQEHFYLESMAAVAYPGEQRTITVLSSTQHPSEVQSVVAEVLGIPFNHVIVQCRRMGGAFGGKETQAAQPAAMAALVAQRTGRPARLVLNRDDDMAWTGKRHPFLARYRVGFTNTGRITALELDLYSNGGCSTDLSPSVLERAMLHSDNAYYLPAARITGRVCKTNLPSNTAFRGFGGPQGMICIENIMQEIAAAVGRDAFDVRMENLYGIDERNVTPYGQNVRNDVLPRLLTQLRTTGDYDRRRVELQRLNNTDKLTLRGLAVSPVKFGISFTKRTLNQANALVNVYLDGTVQVSTGATEMGQGVHTRIRQLVADDLGIPYESVLVAVTSTEKNNNTSPTAASCGTDLNGAAALDATGRIKARLAAFAAPLLADASRGLPASPEHVRFADGQIWDERAPNHKRMTFAALVKQAYFERVSLGERGFYITPGVDLNRETGKGTPFLYFTNGAAIAEVAIDRFTGEMHVPRVDLLMDIGVPINPGIDRGQILGGFIQGMGWCTSEELKYDARGVLLSHSPTTYKIPNMSDLPPEFHLELFDNPDSHVSIKRSKAVGEPPLLLGVAVWCAVKDALQTAANAHGNTAPVKLDLPATNEQILMRMTALATAQISVKVKPQLAADADTKCENRKKN